MSLVAVHLYRPGPRRRLLGIAITLLLGAALLVVLPAPPAQADPCAPLVNPVACENSKTGNPKSEWDVSGSGSTAIQGFATDMSVNVGDTERFKVTTTATSYRLDIYRMGYYGGNGARLIAASVNTLGRQTQPPCLSNATTGLIDCGNWAESASWTVPTSAVSGIYFAKLTRTDGTTGASHVFFVVRNDASHSDLLFQTSDTTWQAYNSYGGNSLYVGSPAGRAYKVSYNRPFGTRGTGPEDFVFNSEYPMVRFMESNGYDVSYFSGVDTDRRGGLLLNHKAFLSVGHDEYWSGGQRTNVEVARDAGVNLAFFSGNEVFWKTRWENSIDASGTPYRTLVTYKETMDNAVTDPQTPTWTGTWADPRFSPPADGGRPQNRLTGTIFKVNSGTVSLKVPAADGKMRFWRGTTVATQGTGATATLGTGTVGYEWDEDADNGFRPPGLIRLSTTQATGVQVLQDYGSTYGTGNATHSLTLYRAPSGALVFGAGTTQWSWGLDSNHDRGSGAASVPMKQATVNLFADMGALPATLQSGLVAATASTDTTAPTTAITAPVGGSSVQAGSPITISGTATDSGGLVGGVEVSTDGGTSWHPATGRATWTYSWTPGATGAVTILARASDDSANLGAPTSVSVTVAARACPCTIWGSGATPTVAADPDGSANEVGVKFRSDVAGQVTALRFYKGTGNTGTHVGHLWAANGTPLASVTFTGETPSGWQQATLATPVTLAAGTTYVVSYYAPSGHYAEDDNYFQASATDAPPLHALKDGTDGPNGVYRSGALGVFPNQGFQSANYWVDVVFASSGADTTPPVVTARTPAGGATGVSTGAAMTATFSESVQAGTISMSLKDPVGTLVAGTQSYSGTSNTVTFAPQSAMTGGMTYTAAVIGAKDLAGNTMDPITWSFTTAASTSGCPCAIWPSTATPAVAMDPDTGAVELGVKFRASQNGFVTGIRFYKGTGNTGTHVGTLWNASGTQQFASVTFAGESASGWQQASFAAPVAVTAGTTYVASYYAPNGRYSVDERYFTSAVTNGPLTALLDGADGSNGVYRYGAGGGFPSSTYLSSNYWVDVVFTTG